MTLITEEYRKMNYSLHKERDDYGRSLEQWMPFIKQLIKPGDSVLNYGCGKSQLKATHDVHVVNYDPAIPGLDAEPEPADIVICSEVLEHIEPECLDDVLDHLRALTKQYCFIVIPNGPAKKCLPDGRNAHLIQEDYKWWLPKLWSRFRIWEFHSNDEALILIAGNGPVQHAS